VHTLPGSLALLVFCALCMLCVISWRINTKYDTAWTSLEKDTVSANSVNAFKSKLKEKSNWTCFWTNYICWASWPYPSRGRSNLWMWITCMICCGMNYRRLGSGADVGKLPHPDCHMWRLWSQDFSLLKRLLNVVLIQCAKLSFKLPLIVSCWDIDRDSILSTEQ